MNICCLYVNLQSMHILQMSASLTQTITDKSNRNYWTVYGSATHYFMCRYMRQCAGDGCAVRCLRISAATACLLCRSSEW